MHGAHPFEGPTRLWWGQFDGREPARQGDAHTRNLFRPVDADGKLDTSQMFRASGLFDMAGRLADAKGQPNRTALHQAMAQLTELLKRLPEPGEMTPEEPGIPAGYTYLLQFIGHDMVDSVVGFDLAAGGLVPTRRNVRGRPLMLETLYGGGPDEVPHAFALDKLPVEDSGFVPRVRLRVGPRRPRPAGMNTTHCPFRDLARGATQDEYAEDAVLSHPAFKDKELLTEAFVADPRNDSHALVAQLTVLFALLHNEVVGALQKVPSAEGKVAEDPSEQERAKREREYREYLCARLIVTDIYRTILFEDVLPKILDPRILERYRSENAPLLGEDEGIPLEFTFGAFRFGHAMVKEDYLVNSDVAIPTGAALRLGSSRRPDRPISDAWLVDWQRFFFEPKKIKAVGGNFSRRLTPSYAAPLDAGGDFAAPTPRLDTAGLMNRDLLASCYAGVLSVEALTSKLTGVFGEDTVWPFEVWRAHILNWLAKRRDAAVAHAGASALASGPVEPLADDPPLPFFVLFEAEFGKTVDETGEVVPINGRHLGPIGSIILAETFYGAASAHPLTQDKTLRAAPLGKRIAAYARAFFPASAKAPDRPDEAAATLAELIKADVTSMPKLLAYLAQRGQLVSASDRSPAGREPKEDAMLNRVEIDADAEDQWGYLVKTWATGVSRFPNDQSTVAVPASELQPPRDLDDLKRQLQRIGIGKKVRIPASLTSLAVIQYSPEVLALRIPPKAMVEESEEALSSPNTMYRIRDFYDALVPARPLSKEEKLRLHACRIGDYSISSCA